MCHNSHIPVFMHGKHVSSAVLCNDFMICNLFGHLRHLISVYVPSRGADSLPFLSILPCPNKANRAFFAKFCYSFAEKVTMENESDSRVFAYL